MKVYSTVEHRRPFGSVEGQKAGVQVFRCSGVQVFRLDQSVVDEIVFCLDEMTKVFLDERFSDESVFGRKCFRMSLFFRIWMKVHLTVRGGSCTSWWWT